MIENLVIIAVTSLVWIAIIAVLYYIGLKEDVPDIPEVPKITEKRPTRNSIYADHVINTKLLNMQLERDVFI